MKVLVIGSGGREHTLAWKIAASEKVTEMFCAPGNVGMKKIAKTLDLDILDNQSILDFVRKEKIDLTVIGPEAPLVNGLADVLRAEGYLCFGPDKDGALMEGSKEFCRLVCESAGVPMAEGRSFTDFNEARNFLLAADKRMVIKADGLAAGKGVLIPESNADAVDDLESMMCGGSFGQAGKKVVIEEFLPGYEVSILAVCSGKDSIILEPSQDHKRIYDNDEGPNTGGMGAYSPVPGFSEQDKQQVSETIIIPVLNELKKRGIDFRGVLYAGLMITSEGIKVLEFNVRFGDPETQVVLPRMKSDLFELLFMAAKGESISAFPLEWYAGACVGVVAASAGYPGKYENGQVITGLDSADAEDFQEIFHAGTKLDGENIITNGGRVLAVSCQGKDLSEAKNSCYQLLDKISFEGIFYRKDIADKALNK